MTREFAGYAALIAYAEREAVAQQPGDIIEIGAFMGGGTAMLADYAYPFGKRVFAVDKFDPTTDFTQDSGGYRMADIYLALLDGRTQREVYEESVQGRENVVTLAVDSMRLRLPRGQQFCFGFIDGNHDPRYVRHDFGVVWRRLVPGGALALDDYEGTLPEVRRTIDGLVDRWRRQIASVSPLPGTRIIALRRSF